MKADDASRRRAFRWLLAGVSAVAVLAVFAPVGARQVLHDNNGITETFPPTGVTGTPQPQHDFTCAANIVGWYGFPADRYDPATYTKPPDPQPARYLRVYRTDDLQPNDGTVVDLSGELPDGTRGAVYVSGPKAGQPVPRVGETLVAPEPLDVVLPSAYGPLAWRSDFVIPLTPGLAPGTLLELLPAGSFGPPQLLQVADCTPPPVSARIDVLPLVSPNVVVPGSQLPIPVVLFGSAELDAGSATNLQLGTATPIVWPKWLKADATADLNRDGFVDRLVWFRTDRTGITCQSTSVDLTGSLANGQTLKGTDAVKPVRC